MNGNKFVDLARPWQGLESLDLNISKDSSYRERSYSPCNKSFRFCPQKSQWPTYKSEISQGLLESRGDSPEHAAPLGAGIEHCSSAHEGWLLQAPLHAAVPGAHHDGRVGRGGPVRAPVHREGRRLVATARHPRGPQADLVEVGGEVVGGDLETSLWCGSLPGQRTPRLRPATVSVVAWTEGPAVTETAVLSTLGSAARQYRGGIRTQSDHVVWDSLQLKPGVSLVGHRAKARLLR